MNLLDKVKIAGRTFDVEYFDFDSVLHFNNMEGNVKYDKQKIQIDNTMHEEHQGMVLLHEILHVISDNLSMGLKENTVKNLGISLYQVLNDNNLFGEVKDGEKA